MAIATSLRGVTAGNGQAYWIKVSAQLDGTFTVTNAADQDPERMSPTPPPGAPKLTFEYHFNATSTMSLDDIQKIINSMETKGMEGHVVFKS
jgi:hypothetical protein